MMTRVGCGTITGIPLAPNEQVLRAVCKCNVEGKSCREFYRVPAMSPIAFECDALTDPYNRMPPTPAYYVTSTT
uniref:EGF-like domain-containing protein n=1 Tax=Angiostrongylus cantonensis TaxID=6313 RepID=A0A0K0DKN6_ANGCA